MRLFLFIIGIFSAVALAGCAQRYPLDMPAEQWFALTAEQQAQARVMDEAIARDQQAYPASMGYEEALAVTAAERARKKAVAKAYRRGRYGDLVSCTLEGQSGSAELEPLPIMLARQEIVPLTLRGAHGEGLARLWIAFDEAATQISLCRHDPRKSGFGPCVQVMTGFQRLEDGVTRRVLIPDALNGSIACRFTPGKGMPKHLSPKFQQKSG